MTICRSSIALMLRNAFVQRSRCLSAICGRAVFAWDLIYDVTGLQCWLMRLSAGEKVTKILIGGACWRNWVAMQDAANLFVDMRIVRYKDFGRLLIWLYWCRCWMINRVLGSAHDKLNAWKGITFIEKNSANMFKFMRKMLRGADVIGTASEWTYEWVFSGLGWRGWVVSVWVCVRGLAVNRSGKVRVQ